MTDTRTRPDTNAGARFARGLAYALLASAALYVALVVAVVILLRA